MINFVANHSSDIILLLIGCVFGYIFSKIDTLIELIKGTIRRSKGEYNIAEIKKIQDKPKRKRSKKEQKALNDAIELTKKYMPELLKK